ncbi:MAG: hypothetical protein ACP6IU_08600 [Candidatus Asgardarchaeia archaeon]
MVEINEKSVINFASTTGISDDVASDIAKAVSDSDSEKFLSV